MTKALLLSMAVPSIASARERASGGSAERSSASVPYAPNANG